MRNTRHRKKVLIFVTLSANAVAKLIINEIQTENYSGRK
jgi:hypothetical protein